MGKNSAPPPQPQSNSGTSSGAGYKQPTPTQHTGLDAVPGFGIIGDIFSGNDPVKGWNERMGKVPVIGSMFNQETPPDAAELAKQDAAQNRPDINTPFGSVSWSTGPDGRPIMNQGMSPDVQGVYNNLKANPLDLNSLPQLQNGEQAREQATQAAWEQAQRRLNPRFAQQDTQMRSRLANSGLDPNSQAARGAQSQFDMARNDAYGSAMNSAISQGREAGDSVFRNSLLGRQNSLSEMLRKRGMPLEDLQGIKGLLSGNPSFNQVSGPGSAIMGQYNQRQGQNQQDMQALMSFLPFLL